MKRLTPLKAIRKKCINCSAGEMKTIKKCPFDGIKDIECPLYPLRMGRGARATLRRIRAYCLWCCNEQRNEIKLCPSVKCPLWEYRFGKRPKVKGYQALDKCPALSEIMTTEGVLESNRV
jgi:hypothetical protein